jgi:hypothetical protein
VLDIKTVSQAADRRDRLTYVLSQINAARGDDSMYVDEESSGESEEEVRVVCSSRWLLNTLNKLAGRRVLHAWLLGTARCKKTLSGVLSAQVGFLTPGETLIGAYYVSTICLHIQSSKTSCATADRQQDAPRSYHRYSKKGLCGSQGLSLLCYRVLFPDEML